MIKQHWTMSCISLFFSPQCSRCRNFWYIYSSDVVFSLRSPTYLLLTFLFIMLADFNQCVFWLHSNFPVFIKCKCWTHPNLQFDKNRLKVSQTTKVWEVNSSDFFSPKYCQPFKSSSISVPTIKTLEFETIF